ncbi:MAG: hypothetical protein ACXQTU_04870 [Candidatus Nezhaarchaeales archaeon]
MRLLTLQLPPEDTFLHLVMKTAIAFIAAYSGADITVKGMHCEVEVFNDERLLDGLKAFYEHLKSGIYGLEPWIPATDKRDRLGGLATKLGFNAIKASASEILEKYISYAEERARRGVLIDELSEALGSFTNEGYVDDAALVKVPMLNRLAPEFMEALRVFGGAGLASVPRQLGFKRLVLGLHSTCIGIMGLWSSYAYTDGAVEHYVFPSKEAIKHKVTSLMLEQITKSFKKFMEAVKNRPLINVNALMLINALSTAGAPSIARQYVLAVALRGGRRIELIEGFTPLFTDKLQEFADSLARLSQDTVSRLIHVAQRSLTRAAGDPVADIALKICQTIVHAVIGVLRSSDAIHALARYTYAQENIEIARRLGLTIADVSNVAEVLRELEIRH